MSNAIATQEPAGKSRSGYRASLPGNSHWLPGNSQWLRENRNNGPKIRVAARELQKWNMHLSNHENNRGVVGSQNSRNLLDGSAMYQLIRMVISLHFGFARTPLSRSTDLASGSAIVPNSNSDSGRLHIELFLVVKCFSLAGK